MSKNFVLLYALAFFLLGRSSVTYAQNEPLDSLHLNFLFQKGSSHLDFSYAENQARVRRFVTQLDSSLAVDGVYISSYNVRGGASLEGSSVLNRDLSYRRAETLSNYLCSSHSFDPSLFHLQPVGEDWESLATSIERLDVPWKQDAIRIIRETPEWVSQNNVVVDSRKNMLRRLREGEAWSMLEQDVFPSLRSARVTAILSNKPSEKTDTVYITTQKHIIDTVFITTSPEPNSSSGTRVPKDYSGRRFLFAVRTNALAIPLANIGLEFPLGRRWSIGVDYYYPWLWRPHHRTGLDYKGSCFELLALDAELRYWFPRKNAQASQRLLGHSLGLYAAGGYFDFERNAAGHQGEFYNIGLDYLYAVPLWGGRMHLEFELGIGFIYSIAQPYDNYELGGKCYRQPGIKKSFNWFGPTRAQLSLVIPVYTRKKGGTK